MNFDKKSGTLINNKIKYNYILLDLYQFIKWIKNNKIIRQSIEHLISIHRNENNFKIINLISEAFNEKNTSNTYYFFIYKGNEIITSCRIIINNKNIAYINMVHTNIKYRNQGFCKKNLSKLLQLVECNKFVLDVDKNNKHAINCYMSIGFLFDKVNVKSPYYKMFVDILDLNKTT